MKIKIFCISLLVCLFCSFQIALCKDIDSKKSESLDSIINKLEKTYAKKGFSANFFQESILKAMSITDTAQGNVIFQPPGKMRWEYTNPDKQIITTDGDKLWIYRPEDNQVLIGLAANFFKDGKGAGFMANFKAVRSIFNISLLKDFNGKNDEHYVLKLIPKTKDNDLSIVYLYISKQNFNITKVVTLNAYEDETIIKFKNIKFKNITDNSVFQFKIPKDVEVLQIGE